MTLEEAWKTDVGQAMLKIVFRAEEWARSPNVANLWNLREAVEAYHEVRRREMQANEERAMEKQALLQHEYEALHQ